MGETRICQVCGQSFTRSAWELRDQSPRHWCSRKCADVGRKRGEERICQSCGASFYLFLGTLREPGRTGAFCSQRCYLQSGIPGASQRGVPKTEEQKAKLSQAMKGRPSARRMPPIFHHCEHCGQQFQVSRHRGNAEAARFCSTACWYEWIRQDPSRIPTWKGGRQPYYGPNWRKQARLARERDSQRCQRCGKGPRRQSLEVHHIRSFREFPSWREANDLSNLITLCKSCHSRAGGSRFYFRRPLPLPVP